MSSFTEPLILQPQDGMWVTTRPLIYEIGKKGSNLLIVVPEGFKTDLATIPRLLWSVFSPFDSRTSAAVVLHDWLYTWQGFDKSVADVIFYEAMGVLGVSQFKRILLYSAVIVCGSFYYNK